MFYDQFKYLKWTLIAFNEILFNVYVIKYFKWTLFAFQLNII